MEGDALAGVFGGRVAVAVAADRAQAHRQNVPQVALNEIDAGDGFGAPGVAAGAVFPREGHRRVADVENAGVGHRGARDIGAQILDRLRPVAEGLEMHAPVFGPHSRLDGGQPGVFRQPPPRFELLPEELPEVLLQHRSEHEEAGTLHLHHATSGVESGPGDNGVDVGMEKQALVPCVQHHREPAASSTQPARVGQRVGERFGGRVKEGAVERAGRQGEEQRPQLTSYQLMPAMPWNRQRISIIRWQENSGALK